MKSKILRRLSVVLFILITPAVWGNLMCEMERIECLALAEQDYDTVTVFLDGVEAFLQKGCMERYDTCRENWWDWLEWIPGCERNKNKCLDDVASTMSMLRLAADMFLGAKKYLCQLMYEDCIERAESGAGSAMRNMLQDPLQLRRDGTQPAWLRPSVAHLANQRV
ncbi:MAG: hypothetical protein F4227_06380 [Gammaproteobacteria bacterium]|nr:hypothetical protein [Gammaproteobacteria bacterium]MYF02589.1 hypothetical protein [Gammaproteobacteria bacterium]MYI76658.1 hypothetical protein [Gammaproteobacteria bacterium]